MWQKNVSVIRSFFLSFILSFFLFSFVVCSFVSFFIFYLSFFWHFWTRWLCFVFLFAFFANFQLYFAIESVLILQIFPKHTHTLLLSLFLTLSHTQSSHSHIVNFYVNQQSCILWSFHYLIWVLNLQRTLNRFNIWVESKIDDRT